MSLELTALLFWRLEFVSLENEARPIDSQKALIVNSFAQVKFCLTNVYSKIKWNAILFLI